MALVRTRAVVLQAFPYSDSSKILRLYTPELGLRSVIAKGAQRPRSRFGAVLEPFTEGEAHFHLREGRDLHTLSGFDLIRSRQSLGRDLTAFAAASLVAELVLRSGTEEPNPRLYRLLVEILERLAVPAELSPALESLGALWRLVAELGYQPELESCVACGRPLPAGVATRFDVDAGGVACTLCRPAGRVIDPVTRGEIRRMAAGEPPREGGGDLALQRALLRVFVAAHLTHGTPLRSLPLYLEQLR